MLLKSLKLSKMFFPNFHVFRYHMDESGVIGCNNLFRQRRSMDVVKEKSKGPLGSPTTYYTPVSCCGPGIHAKTIPSLKHYSIGCMIVKWFSTTSKFYWLLKSLKMIGKWKKQGRSSTTIKDDLTDTCEDFR